MPDTPDNQGFQPVPLPPAAPPKQGSSALKIVLIIVAIFVGIGLLGAAVVGYGVYKVAKAVKMSANSSEPVTSGDLGVAIYPGATQGKGTLRMTIAGKAMVTANYQTSDSKDQVLAFYQSNLGPQAQIATNANGGTLILNRSSGDSVTVTVAQNPGMHDGQTQIVIVRARNASSN